VLQSSPNYKFFTRTIPSDATSAHLVVRLLYNSSVFTGWNNVAVIHQDDAWGKGYVTQMELELRRVELRRSTPPEAASDVIPRTLLRFAFTNSHGSVERALKAVNSSGYSVIVVVGRFHATSHHGGASSLVDFLEVPDTPTRRACLSAHLLQRSNTHRFPLRSSCARLHTNTAW
jgi:hypothetical protein